MSRRSIKILFCWVITVLALYYAFHAAKWDELFDHIRNANKRYILFAFCLTIMSYFYRARRWQFLFPEKRSVSYITSAKVLILGFFMNNILPARAGEIVRAHMGSKATGMSRTLVLATIASERLLDGLAISLYFVIFSFGIGGSKISHELLYVAYLFAVATAGVGLVILFRNKIFRAIEALNDKLGHKAADYTLQRIKIFIDGLGPLFYKERFPIVSLWSLFIWLNELMVFTLVGLAYGVRMDLSFYVLFMVALNFSSLIPAAPGGIGVVEAVVKTVLVSVGIDPEVALAMVLTQHIMQYVVVGVPGAIIMFTWRDRIKQDEIVTNIEGAGSIKGT